MPTVAVAYCRLSTQCPELSSGDRPSTTVSILCLSSHLIPTMTSVTPLTLFSFHRRGNWIKEGRCFPHSHAVGCYWTPITTCFNGDLLPNSEVPTRAFQASLEGNQGQWGGDPGLVGRTFVPFQCDLFASAHRGSLSQHLYWA